MESFTREVRERMYLWICYHKSSQAAGRRVVNGDPATIMLAAAVALKIDLPERRAGNVLRKFVGLLRCPEGAVRGGHKAVMVCEKDPVDLGGSSWEAAFRSAPEPPPDAGSAPVRVERGMGKYARSIYARLRKEVSGAPSIAAAAAMRFLIGGKMELAVERASQLLSAYQVFGVIAWQNGKDQTGGIRFLHNVEDWDDKDQSTVAQFLDRVEGGEKLEVKPRDERPQPPLLPVKPPAPLVPPTPPSPKPPPKPEPPRAQQATELERGEQGPRRAGRRKRAAVTEAERLLSDPLNFLPTLEAAAATSEDSVTVRDPIVVLRRVPGFYCLSIPDLVTVLVQLRDRGLISLSARQKEARLLPRKPSVPPSPPEETVPPLDRLSAEDREHFVQVLCEALPKKARADGLFTLMNPATVLANGSDLTPDQALPVIVRLVQAGCLRDITKRVEGKVVRQQLYAFLVDREGKSLYDEIDAVRTAADQSREAQKRRADLEAVQTQLVRVTEEIDLLYPRFQALLTERDKLAAKIRCLQGG